jgi:hypothetical protein
MIFSSEIARNLELSPYGGRDAFVLSGGIVARQAAGMTVVIMNYLILVGTSGCFNSSARLSLAEVSVIFPSRFCQLKRS